MLGIVLLWIFVYLSGMLFCKISGEKETSQLWKHLIGFFFLIFCQGLVFFCGQLLGWSFSQSGILLRLLFLMIAGISILVCRKEIVKMLNSLSGFSWKKIRHGRYWALLLWLFLGIGLVVGTCASGNRNDAMVETVYTTLMTDSMNQYHPFTKEPLELGMIFSRKIITLPFWYSILSTWTGISVTNTVWVLGTLITTAFSLMAYGELAGLLFYRNFRRSWFLVVLIELLYLSGDYYTGAAGYRQLFYGYSGEVITASVFIPCILTIFYRFFGSMMRLDFPTEKEKLSVWGVIVETGLCLGSCLFVTSVSWGILMLMTAAGLFMLSVVGVRLSKRIRGHEG